MNTERCPHCEDLIDMDDLMADLINDEGSGPHNVECPHCDKTMKVEVEWEPVYFVRPPQQAESSEGDA